VIKNYLKIALANIYKSKVYSLISISSLAVGMAVCILLLLYVSDELSWWVFGLAGIITIIIVLTTVSWVTYRAAHRNPVEALRYE
jgi:ABC-type antimicrobial peptide transport system permease subunit